MEEKMRKFLAILLAVSMLLCVLASCDIEDTNPDTAPVTDAPTEKPTEAPAEETTEAPTAEPTVDSTPTETEAPTAESTDAPTSEATELPTETPTEAPTDAPTDAPTEVPTEAPTEAPTAAPTDAPTEAPTEQPTDAPTAAPTEEPTEAPTEEPTEAPTEGETGVHFEDDFMLSGEYADELKSALKVNKVNTGSTSSDTVIYVGEADADIVSTAKANLTKPNNYYDFTIVTDGKDLAIYAPSALAIENAIAYLIENFTDGGHIAVPDNFTYTHLETDLTDIKLGGNTLENTTIVASPALSDIASGLAEDLTILTGFNLQYAEAAEGAQIALVASGSGSAIGAEYTVAYSNGALTVTAENKVTLAYAISGLIKLLKSGAEIAEGFSETYTLETKTADATDIELFKYCGTWQATDEANPTTMVSYWDAAYVEVDFTGNAITLTFSSPTTFLYRVDGGDYVTVSGISGDYTVYANGGGTHTVRVLYNDKGKSMYFAGVKVGGDVALTRTPDKKYYVQFVGDSISDATNSFSHNSADIIDWDYSVIACEALSMVKDMGYWRYNNGCSMDGTNTLTEGSMAWHFQENFGVTSVGMEDAYFKLGIPNKWSTDDPRFADVAANYYTEKYDFKFETGNTPDIVFIFLGTNDISKGSSNAAIRTFIETYVKFVEKLFELYGEDTQIVVMQSLSTSDQSAMYDTSHPRFVAVREVAKNLEKRYPDNVTFLDENTLFSWGVEISSDGTHPSAAGYETLSKKVAQWLKKEFK